MESLVKLLEGADNFKQALEKLKGKDIVMEGRPWGDAWSMEILETKSDYFVAMWKGNTSKKEFFAKYDNSAFFSLKG